MKLTDLTLAEASDLIAKQEISSEELTQAHLKRISQLEPTAAPSASKVTVSRLALSRFGRVGVSVPHQSIQRA